MKKNKIFVIYKNEVIDYDENSNVVLVTSNKKIALDEMQKCRVIARNYAKENGYIFDDGKLSIEVYPEGYAAETHLYYQLYETTLVEENNKVT